MQKLVYIFLTAFLVLQARVDYAQLTTNNSQSPAQLVANTLVGNGVAVSNVVYTGSLDAIGSFNGANTNLGLNSGVILTTGTVLNSGGVLGGAQGPHGPNDEGSAGVDNGEPGYGPLTNLAGADTYNAAILEFDFIPNSDTVRFRYVFGSEEYPEYVDGGFNDAFAFFISGPGISGSQNMALIPGGGGIVSIDNVNNGSANSGPCQNCAYYINNGTGTTSPQNGSDYYIQYDGFTTVLEAVSPVQCGQTYHLVIAIADAGDGAYDSGIFLEANSLSSFAPVEMNHSLALDGFQDNFTMAEGCETATVTVTRPQSVAQDALSIPVIVSGTATEGVDYTNIPNSIDFAAGQTSVSFSFDVLGDAIAEGTESVIIQLNQPDPCGNSNFITLELAIQDIDPLQVTVPDKNLHCPGEDTWMVAQVTGGLEPYTFNWDVGGTNDSLLVNPTTTTTYSVTVNDACIGSPTNGSGQAIVPVYPPLQLITSPDTSVLCPNTPHSLYAEATGGEGAYVYSWYQGATFLGNGPSLAISPMVTTDYTVIVTDGCGMQISEIITYTVQATVVQLTMSPEQLICPGDSAEIFVTASGGLGNYTYYWHHSGETTDQVTVKPNNTTTYTVSVQDDCATYTVEGQTTVKVVRPQADFNVLTEEPMENLPVFFQNTTNGGVAWEWDFGNGDFSTDHSPHSTYNPWGYYDVTLIAYNQIGCADTVTKTIYIKPEFYFFAPNAFTPDGNRFNNEYEVSVIGAIDFEFQIFNRWGELIYSTTDQYFRWDGTYNGVIVPDEVVVWKAKVVDREETIHTFSGHITILK